MGDLDLKNFIKPLGAVRRTISIPMELDIQMTDHPEFNWSAVARQAFEEVLAKLKENKKQE